MNSLIIKKILAIILVILTLFNLASFASPQALGVKATAESGDTSGEDADEEDESPKMNVYFYHVTNTSTN